MSDEEWQKHTKNVVRLVQDINSEEDLRDFATKEQSTYDFHDMP